MRRERRKASSAVRIGRRLTYANVMATIAVFGVLAGGGAYAAAKIGANDIKPGAVRAKHIKNDQVKAKHVAKNAVGAPAIRDGAVTAPKLACEGNSPQDQMVRVGSVCIDKYENSIWSARTGGSPILGQEPLPCNINGQDCKGKIFARSVAGVPPHTDITWFQAQQALANSGKRLPTNAEWQMAVAGTPDPGETPGPDDCNTNSSELTPAGQRANCISDWGANDMIGNAWEWVADWDEKTSDCANWDAEFGDDLTCVGQASEAATTYFPGALMRGGESSVGTNAGAFATQVGASPAEHGDYIGFRGAR